MPQRSPVSTREPFKKIKSLIFFSGIGVRPGIFISGILLDSIGFSILSLQTTTPMRMLLSCILVLLSSIASAQEYTDTVPAHYPGGPGAWARYLIKHFRVPPGVEPDGHSVQLAFNISATGKISAVRMIKGDTMLRKNLIELLLKSQPWIPAKVADKSVASTQYIPINYCLERK